MVKRKDGFYGQRALVIPNSIRILMESNEILSHLHITDIGYYPKAKYHYRERGEPISQYVFIYCMEGRGWFKIEGELFTVSANQFFILPSGINHSYGADKNSPWTIYWIHFKGTMASHFASFARKPIDINPSKNSRISTRIDMFEEILYTLELGYNIENLLYANSIFHHYLGTLRYIQQYRKAGSNDSSQGDTIQGAIHFMQENIEKRLSLFDIAHNVGYSSSHFSVLFKQVIGYSPLDYFNRLKIQKSCNLLDFSEMKINQIAFKVGIEDSYYFSRLFSKIMGMSPSDYKRTKKG